MSPKNKGTFGKGKSQVEEKDEFISGVEKIANALRPYALKIAVLVGVVVIGVLIFTVYGWWDDKKEKEGTQLYVEATEVLRRPVTERPPEPPPTDPNDPLAQPPEPPPITYRTLSDKASVLLEATRKLESDGSGTDAATQGKLLQARALVDLDRHDEAIKLYKSYASSAPNEVVRTIAREGIGYAIEAKAVAASDPAAREALLKEALEAFRAVQPKENGPRWLYGLYHEARLRATLNERDKAAELFRKILESEPPAELEDAANARLAMLDTAGPAPKKAPAKPDDTPEPPDDEGGDGDDAPADGEGTE